MNNKTLQLLNVNNVAPNPYNPRVFFDEDEMALLRESIKKVGILVPITVYTNTKKHPEEKYIILDGERRWRCAKSIGITDIPANIIDEPEDITQNILYMFNIHHFRTEWELVPTALKLELIIKRIENDSESVLSEFTGLTRSTVRRCKMLLWYPVKYRQELLNKSTIYSTDFLIELYPIVSKLSYEVLFLKSYSIESFVDKIAQKYSKSDSFDIKDIRVIRRSYAYCMEKDKLNEFMEMLNEFLSSNKGIEVFVSDDLESDKTRKNTIKSLVSLNELVKKINPDIVSDEEFVGQLAELLNSIKTLLEKIE